MLAIVMTCIDYLEGPVAYPYMRRPNAYIHFHISPHSHQLGTRP